MSMGLWILMIVLGVAGVAAPIVMVREELAEHWRSGRKPGKQRYVPRHRGDGLLRRVLA